MDGGRARVVSWPDLDLRRGSWGSAEDRQFVTRLASDIADKAGFQICVLEVVRVDLTVERVAVHGDAGDLRVGHVRPLAFVEADLPGVTTHGDLTFFAAEGGTRQATRPGQATRIPGPRPDDEAHAWSPGDRLVAQLRDEQGALRALVRLDCPLDGHRRRGVDLRTLSDDLQVLFRSLVTAVDRELLAQQVRLARAVRRVLRSAANDTDAEDLLDLVRGQMREAFRADELHINLTDDQNFPGRDGNLVSPALYDAFVEASARAWSRDDVIIIEANHVWGDEILHRSHSAEIARIFRERRLGTMVVVPIGDNALLLGSLTIVRFQDGPRWTESESLAALDVGRDLGHALLNARAAEREAQLHAELRTIYDRRTEAIATLSHELNNPTGVILGHIEMLQARQDLDDTVRRSLAAIGRSATRIADLTEDLLVLRVLEDPHHPLDVRPVDLSTVVDEVIDLAQLFATQAGVEVGTEVTTGDVVVMGDPAELTQVVTNLVNNAIKYTDPGGHVCVRLARDGDEVEMTCTDDGIGISADDVRNLFREFFRSTNNDALRRPGNGLGLAIVERIVTRHEGRVVVESEPGKGTTFRVTLPAAV